MGRFDLKLCDFEIGRYELVMLCVAQRVQTAKVIVNETNIGEIGRGLLCLVGVVREDDENDLAFMFRKIPRLRIFPDEMGKMNRSLVDIGGGLLLVSQFTLAADTKKGTRPSFQKAMEPVRAEAMFNRLVEQVSALDGITVATGRFGADMKVHLVNDGPVTIPLDSRK